MALLVPLWQSGAGLHWGTVIRCYGLSPECGDSSAYGFYGSPRSTYLPFTNPETLDQPARALQFMPPAMRLSHLLSLARWWMVRVTIGLRLVPNPQLGPLIPTRRRFTLAEFLCGVAICATTLGAARLVAPRDLTYFTWFAIPKEVLSFVWSWSYTAVIAIPTAIILVYSEKPLWAVCYFLVAITAIVVQRRWAFVGRMQFSSWRFYWVLEAFRVAHVVAHVMALLLGLKCLGYSLSWKSRSAISTQ